MKTGFPYLRISQKHNVDYSDVLYVADHIHKKKDFHENIPALPVAVLFDIEDVKQQHDAIMRGDRPFSDQYEVFA